MDATERFWAKVNKTDDCWLWTASTNLKGYGFFAEKATRPPHLVYAHRYSYELAYGPVPDGKYVLHHCDTPSCVRPDHLFVGTIKDNVDDMCDKGRHHDERGEKNPYAKLSEAQVIAMREKYQAGATQRDLAKEFNVSKGTVYYVVNSIRWDHI